MGDTGYKMKYKIGDKVRIKTWEELEAEFGYDYDSGCIRSNREYTQIVENDLCKLNSDRIITVEYIYPYCGDSLFEFRPAENDHIFGKDCIKEIVYNDTSNTNTTSTTSTILSRFELLDIR